MPGFSHDYAGYARELGRRLGVKGKTEREIMSKIYPKIIHSHRSLAEVIGMDTRTAGFWMRRLGLRNTDKWMLDWKEKKEKADSITGKKYDTERESMQALYDKLGTVKACAAALGVSTMIRYRWKKIGVEYCSDRSELRRRYEERRRV